MPQIKVRRHVFASLAVQLPNRLQNPECAVQARLAKREWCWAQDFVDKVKEDPVDNFEIDYKQGAPPVLHLYDKSGDEASDPISISQWKSEHIFEFLQSKLAGSR
jgi:hypothetical protein